MTTLARSAGSLLLQVFLAVLLVLSLFVLNATGSSAHAWNFAHTNGRWINGSNINYYFRDAFPGGEYRARVIDGFNAWNYATGTSDTAEPDFYSAGQTAVYGSWNRPCSNSINIVYWYDLDAVFGTSTLGAAMICPYYENSNPLATNTSTRNTRFTLAIDNDRAWYTGTGADTGGRDDLWSTAAHEAGHATGWIPHFSANAPECALSNPAYYHTMCPQAQTGWTRARMLELHDYHTFGAAYPW